MNHTTLIRQLHYSATVTMNKDEFYRALIWVEENLSSGEDINSLVMSAGCSRRSFEQRFRAYSGFSPGEYLFRRRMTRAAVMLRMTSLQVTEIAALLHYHSGQNFTRAFRRFFGSTPTDYRRKNEWNTQTLQHPLLYGDIISHSKIVNFSHPLKITGSRKCTESRYDSMSDHDYLTTLRNQLNRQKRSSDSQELLVFCKTTDTGNTFAHRKGIVKVETVIGRYSVQGDIVDGIIPSGKYIEYEFRGAWNDFSVFSRTIYLNSLTELKWHCIGDYSFMKVCSFKTNLHCKLYIPAGKSS